MKIPFYYDYTCPWAYIGSSRVEAYFADLNVTIDYRPVYLKQLMEPMLGPAPETRQTYGSRKSRYYEHTRDYIAESCGAAFGDADKRIRADTALLLKASLVARDAGRFMQFHSKAFHARWLNGLDVSQPQVIAKLLEDAGVDAGPGLSDAMSSALDRRLSEVTEAAIAEGIFGVPTLVVGDRILWGNDHFEVARYYIKKYQPVKSLFTK